MKTQDILQAWLDEPLKELELTEDQLPKFLQGKDAHLFLRELPVDEGASLISACRNKITNEIDQGKLVVGIVIKTIRNADDPDKALVFSESGKPDKPAMAYRDMLVKKGIAAIQTVANLSIILSGLNEGASQTAKNDSTQTTTATIAGDDSSLN